MPDRPPYWFPAKRFGWGWGPPQTWEGWAALAALIGLAVAGVIAFPPTRGAGAFVAYQVALSLLFLALCWWKGEPPRWRWGGE